jgi:hypothetical protein
MTTKTLNERFFDEMWPRVCDFQSSIGDLDTSGIPEPHLPHWGRKYESGLPKIGVIGRDTRGWGHMPQFIEAVSKGDKSALFRGKTSFESLKFTSWTNNFGKTFWDTSIKLLAGVYDVHDWKSLKKKQIIDPLESFFWANVNSVERYEATPAKNRISRDTWLKIKSSSEKHIDSFRLILDIFRPDIVFLLSWDASEEFLDFPLSWNEFGDYQLEAIDPETGCLVLRTAHPTWLNQNKLYDQAISGLIKRAKNATNIKSS